MVWKKVTNSDAGDSNHFGGDDVDKISLTFNAETQTDPINIKDENLYIVDPADTAKKVRFDAGGITSSQTRVITIPDANITLASTTAASTSVAGLMSAADKTKLDAVEASATADQTNAQIVAAVEAGTDSNTFTDADHSKLNAIEASATADQSNSEIKTAYEANSDTNAFTDANVTTLGNRAPLASPALTGTATGVNLTLSGNLTVNGTTTTLDTTNLAITDKNIMIADGSSNNAASNGAGITIEGGSDADKTITWASATGDFDISENVDIASGKLFKVDGATTLSATALGSAVVSSSLTSVGTLGTLSVDNLTIDANKIEATNTNGNVELDSNGTGVVKVLGNTNDGAITLNCTDNSHGQTIKSQPHSESATNTMLLPKGANSTLVSLVSADTLTNKTLTSPTLTTPALGTPASGVLSGCTALPAAQVTAGTMQSGMTLVAPVLGTPASGDLQNCTALPAAQLTGVIADARMPNLTGAITTVEGAVATTLVANSVDSDNYVDASIDVAHMSANSVDSDQYVDASIDLAHLAADSVDGSKIVDDAINSEHITDGSVDLAHLSADSVNGSKIADDAIDSEHYTNASIDLAHMSANSVDSDQYVDGSIDNAHIADDAINSEHYADASIDLAHLSADCVNGTKIADNAINSEHYTDASIDTAHLSASLTITSPTIAYAINAQTGTSYTTVLADAGKIITSNNGSAVTITIPPNSGVAYPTGSSLTIISIGAGLTSITEGSGVTINSTGADPDVPVIRAAHSSATCIKTATNTWQVVGDIA